jgi:hypothetical protein
MRPSPLPGRFVERLAARNRSCSTAARRIADATFGDCFVIGQRCSGSSAVGLVAPDARPLLQSRTVTVEELKQVAFRDAPHQIDVLSRLPVVISSAGDDPELFVQFVSMLLAGIPRADAVALVALEPPGKDGAVVVLHADRRRPGEGELRPSHRLTRQAIGGGGETVLHVWAAETEGTAPSPFTLRGTRLAFCTRRGKRAPAGASTSRAGSASPRWTPPWPRGRRATWEVI